MCVPTHAVLVVRGTVRGMAEASGEGGRTCGVWKENSREVGDRERKRDSDIRRVKKEEERGLRKRTSGPTLSAAAIRQKESMGISSMCIDAPFCVSCTSYNMVLHLHSPSLSPRLHSDLFIFISYIRHSGTGYLRRFLFHHVACVAMRENVTDVSPHLPPTARASRVSIACVNANGPIIVP